MTKVLGQLLGLVFFQQFQPTTCFFCELYSTSISFLAGKGEGQFLSRCCSSFEPHNFEKKMFAFISYRT